jgi:hypothetical protein
MTLYTKTIEGRQVISDCRNLFLDGRWVSNPSKEQIFADGWVVYVPPVIPTQPQTEPDYGAVLEAVKKMFSTATEELTDEQALDVAALYPTWSSRIGELVAVGERYWYDGKLYKVVQAHTAQAEWTPATTPALFAEVSIEEWPAWRQPVGASDAYNKDAKVTHIELHWISDVDANVWEPGVYGWTRVV